MENNIKDDLIAASISLPGEISDDIEERYGEYAHKNVCTDAVYVIERLESEIERLQGIISAVKEFDDADGDAYWEAPHPIFRLSDERDFFMGQYNKIKEKLDAIRQCKRYDVRPLTGSNFEVFESDDGMLLSYKDVLKILEDSL